eukprot:TRINITY_DN1207_c0_g1_i1.p1 TRINITY_DN1207_c0_g1~~TRINITY_DN1207_c0_g1_i1.p1  ORF type:complete len:500 (-),score=200.90 TRINITY_DN1207_c0_g1_i1:112-1611(-)
MPRKKKKWIDKKNATTYTIINKPEAGDDDLPPNLPEPKKKVKPFLMKTEDGQFEDADSSSSEDPSPPAPSPPPSDADYDYSKHIRPIGNPGGVFIKPSGQMVPSEEVAEPTPPPPAIDEDEVDEDVIEALEHYDESKFEELPDNFFELANKDLEDDKPLQSYGSLDDIEDDEPAPKAGNHGKSGNIGKIGNQGKSGKDGSLSEEFEDEFEFSEEEKDVRRAPQETKEKKLEDDLFDFAVRKFEKDLQEMYQSDPSDDEMTEKEKEIAKDPRFNYTRRTVDASVYEEVFDEFLQNPRQSVQYQTFIENKQKRSDLIEVQAEEMLRDLGDEKSLRIVYEAPKEVETIKKVIFKSFEKEDEEEVEEVEERFVKKQKAQWDCESIISTYSNLENHPALIVEPLSSRIVLNKKGFPKGKKEVEEVVEEEKEEVEEKEESKNLGCARAKKESGEEKKLRKKAVKEDRQVKREKKKELKMMYREETIKERTRQATGTLENRTILHL